MLLFAGGSVRACVSARTSVFETGFSMHARNNNNSETNTVSIGTINWCICRSPNPRPTVSQSPILFPKTTIDNDKKESQDPPDIPCKYPG